MRLKVEVYDFWTVNFFLRMIRRVDVAAASENVHSTVYHSCGVEVAVWRRRSEGVDECPLHQLQIQAVDVLRELIQVLLEATENIHFRSDDAGGVPVTSPRKTSTHFWRFPLEGLRVEAKQNITNLKSFNEILALQMSSYATRVYLPSRHSGHRKCKLCFRMQQLCVLQWILILAKRNRRLIESRGTAKAGA